MPHQQVPIASDRVTQLGFSWYRGRPDPSISHRHPEIELMVIQGNPVTWRYAGRPYRLRPNDLVVAWGIRLHGARIGHTAMTHVLRLPLPWLLQWQLPGWFVQRLLGSEPIVDRPAARVGSDLERMRRWESLMREGSPEAQRIVVLEAQARLHELAMRLERHRPGTMAGVAPVAMTRFERMARLIAEGYRDHLSVQDIARAVGLHRVSAARLFRNVADIGIHEFLTQHRLAHAQQLLATTDVKVSRIVRECGFRSATRFHEAFRANIGLTPGEYRRRSRGLRPGVAGGSRHRGSV